MRTLATGDDLGETEEAPAGYRTQSPDTIWAIERHLVARDLLLDCCRMVEQLSLVGVRTRHPNADEREVFLRAATQPT